MYSTVILCTCSILLDSDGHIKLTGLFIHSRLLLVYGEGKK